MNRNITVLTDSYKIGHYDMYPEGTETVYSYFESRKGARFNETVFFGLQYLLKEYLCGQVVTKESIDKGQAIVDAHLGPNVFNREGWEYILKEYNGHLPLEIKAVPEGTPVDVGNVLMTVENTDPKCFWLSNFSETLLTHVWSASTVATLSREVKKLCKSYLGATSDNQAGLNFMLHDFGYRGVSSVESAGFQGAGHLVNFFGTDTIAAIELLMNYYNSGVCAFSVPATEHSIMTARGEEGEKQVFKDLLDKYPTGILSVVIDSYDYHRFIREYAEEFKDQILARDGKVVFRPDSGDPVKVVRNVLKNLEIVFGSTENSKGFGVLNPKVGVLWGDGIDIEGIKCILNDMLQQKWSAENIVFGMGGGLLQKVNRDTQRFAFKSSAQKRNGEWFDIYKDPIDSSKASKKGKLALTKRFGFYETINPDALLTNKDDLLETVFLNGKLIKEYSLDQIRKNAELE